MAEGPEPSSSPASEHDYSELFESFAAPEPRLRPIRQGLPAEYRMRHDAHYVEELAARPSDTSPDPAASAASIDPPLVSMPEALRDLCQEFEALASCFNLLERRARPLRERLGLSLATIGVQRGIQYAQQLRVLLENPRPVLREIRLDDAIRRACDELREELRLTETTLTVDVPASPLVVRADASLLQTAIRACAAATIGLIELGGKAADLQVSAFKAGDVACCEFQQQSYAMPGEPTRAISVALGAARRIAQLHGGTLDARPTSAGGSVLSLSLA